MAHYIQAASLRWYNACAYYAVTLSQGLTALGHRLTFAGAYGTRSIEKAGEYGIELLTKKSRKTRWHYEQIRYVNAYRRFALSHNVTLVNVHHGHDHLLWSCALRGTGIPVIRTSGNQIPPRVHMLSRFLIKKHTAGIIASSKKIRDFYSEGFGIEADRIPVINGGINTDYYSPEYTRGNLRSEIGIPEDAFVFGIIGRFSPDKGHEHFFRAAGIVAQDHPEVRFIVAGSNAQLTEDDIRGMAGQAGILDKTFFPGRYPDSRDIIGSLDAGVVASVRSEMICRIAMEYMAMGIPVIASRTNVLPEIIRHNESGLVVPSGNPEAMAEAMRHLLVSQEKTKILGKRGREIAREEYSLESFAVQTLEAYRSILDNGR